VQLRSAVAGELASAANISSTVVRVAQFIKEQLPPVVLASKQSLRDANDNVVKRMEVSMQEAADEQADQQLCARRSTTNSIAWRDTPAQLVV
jgi:hypothetical protein